MKKILIYDDTLTSIQTSALELYKVLIESGFDIDLMLDSSNFQNRESFYHRNEKHINIINLFEDKRRFVISKNDKIKYYLMRLTNLISTRIKKRYFSFTSSKQIELEQYFCVLATSETSLKLSIEISRGKLPVIYYCTELYSEVLLNPSIKTYGELKKYLTYMRLKKYVSKAHAIIIQDEDRWNVFSSANKLPRNFKHLYYPVSINRYVFKDYSPSNSFIATIIEKCKGKKIIFYPTVFVPARGCEEIINAVEQMNDDYVLIMHGFNGSSSFIRKLEKLQSDRVIISHCSLNYEDLIYLNSVIWCGILYYGEENYNDRFISNSCNKLVAYLQAGKPIMTFGNTGLANLVTEYQCGFCLNEFAKNNMIDAVEYINKNYSMLSKNALKCYSEKYDAKKNSEQICEFILRLEEKDD